MQKLDILSDGPFRYVHSTASGALITTLIKAPNGKFADEDDASIERTLRQWRAILSKQIRD